VSNSESFVVEFSSANKGSLIISKKRLKFFILISSFNKKAEFLLSSASSKILKIEEFFDFCFFLLEEMTSVFSSKDNSKSDSL
jgi:hypothetical protein